ncbi:hypothetical protein ACHAW6_006865 [Cyclotella cf. meneghiniana]
MPPSRRRILTESLPAFGATPLYSSNNAHGAAHENHQCVTDNAATSAEASPIGISIGGWKIITQNSTIGDERGMERLTSTLEDVADPSYRVWDDHAKSSLNSSADSATRNRRRLCPPEITFLDSTISIRHTAANSTITEIRFTARESLMEWAEAHRYLDRSFDTNNGGAAGRPARKEYRGVTILQTADAEKWSRRSSKVHTHEKNNAQFYYDWTFATPYAGSVHLSTSEDTHTAPKQRSIACINNRNVWGRPLSYSRIPFHLLQDTTQPILLYDDISLFEDDLHDNGDVSLNVKVRVMPQCWYVLQRLFIRVDHVCVKCREVRMFCFFGDHGGSGETLLGGDVEENTVYRDVVWREASWDDLLMMGLPVDPAKWREDRENAGMIASLIARLPTAQLPDDLPRYSSVRVV